MIGRIGRRRRAAAGSARHVAVGVRDPALAWSEQRPQQLQPLQPHHHQQQQQQRPHRRCDETTNTNAATTSSTATKPVDDDEDKHTDERIKKRSRFVRTSPTVLLRAAYGLSAAILLAALHVGLHFGRLKDMALGVGGSDGKAKPDDPLRGRIDRGVVVFGSGGDGSAAAQLRAGRRHRKKTGNYHNDQDEDLDDEPSRVRIAYALHRPEDVPYVDEYNPTKCQLGPDAGGDGRGNRRRPYDRIDGLPPSLKRVDGDGGGGKGDGRKGGILLDFTTTVTTDLNLLLMGDSVGAQLFQGLQEAAGSIRDRRTVYRESWPGHEGLAVSAPVRGGGAVAGWRITGMLRREGEFKALPNNHGGGWSRDDVGKLLGHQYPPWVGEGTPMTNRTLTSIDAVLFRIPHGWIDFDKIDRDAVRETIELSYELFGASTVVFINVPFSNNVRTPEDLKRVHETNDLIRDVAQGLPTSHPNHGVRTVLVLDWGSYSLALYEANARTIGYDVDAMATTRDYLFDRMSILPKHPMSIPQVCAEKVPPGSDKCLRNYVSLDGMHWCMPTVGGRFFAGVSCLLGCVYNHVDDEDEGDEEGKAAASKGGGGGGGGLDGTNEEEDELRRCERRCNEQFMSMRPLDEGLIGGKALASSIGTGALQ